MTELADLAATCKRLSAMFAYPTDATAAAIRAHLGVEVDLVSLRGDYQAIFGGPLPGTLPPLEAEYDQAHVFAKAHTLADLAGFYRAFGLEPSGGMHRVDHIAVELEFAHVLAAKEARALALGDAEHASVCAAARRTLFAEHLGPWAVPYLATAAKQAPGVYAKIAEEARAFLEGECRMLGIVLPPRATKRTEAEPTAADMGCAVPEAPR